MVLVLAGFLFQASLVTDNIIANIQNKKERRKQILLLRSLNIVKDEFYFASSAITSIIF